ncbi:MAG: hypothetical protein ACOYIH_11965 [Candidatus Fimadaptatus sp.]|jgi:K+-sensing histidine kinase KdpD
MFNDRDAASNNVAVCVTGQRDCDKLIHAGRELADELGGELVVMSALPRLYDGETARVLEYLYSCSTQSGAQMLVMYTNEPMEALRQGFEQQHIGHVLLGAPGRRSSQMGARLMGGYPQARYYSLDSAGRAMELYQTMNRAVR